MMVKASRTLAALVMMALVASPPAWAYKGSVVCESKNRGNTKCRVDTQGKVSLSRQLSKDSCRQNKTWGYSDREIWVDKGCRGEFEFGRDGGSSNSGKKDAAIAAGIIGAFALGAAVANQSNTNDPPPYTPPRPYTPPPPPVPGYATPGWAVGSFNAWDGEAGQTVQLVVPGTGRVNLRDEWGRVINWGDLRDGFIYWSNGSRSWLAREGYGVRMGDVNTGRNFEFRRS
jgi:hypothetical protein